MSWRHIERKVENEYNGLICWLLAKNIKSMHSCVPLHVYVFLCMLAVFKLKETSLAAALGEETHSSERKTFHFKYPFVPFEF